MAAATDMLRTLATDFARVIPSVDAAADHDRWDPGIGPFEEENQRTMILEALAEDGDVPAHIRTEVQYPESQRRCDLFLDTDGQEIPVEAKLLRFRLDNGNIDPNMYTSVFSPFPERSSSSLLTDAKKLASSSFGPPYGLLGLYYEADDEPYEKLTAANVAEKFARDVAYWYDIAIETVAIAHFDGLRHPHHQRGAVITWQLEAE